MNETNDILKENFDFESPKKFGIKEKTKTIVSLITMLIITYLLWDPKILNTINLGFLSYILYPIKLFVNLIHLISHGIVAIITGAHFSQILLHTDKACHFYCCVTRFPNWFSEAISGSAGYLGSILFGCLILNISIKTNWSKFINILIGITILLITLLFRENLFTIIFSILFSFFMILVGTKFADKINGFILQYIGLTSCLFAFFDIFLFPFDITQMPSANDIHLMTNVNPIYFILCSNDSYIVSRAIGMPFLKIPLTILWLILSALALYFTLKITFETEEK